MNAYLARGVGNWDLIKRTPPTPSSEEGLLSKTNKQQKTNIITSGDLHLCSFIPVQIYTCADLHLCGFTPVRIYTCADLHLCGFTPARIYKPRGKTPARNYKPRGFTHTTEKQLRDLAAWPKTQLPWFMFYQKIC